MKMVGRSAGRGRSHRGAILAALTLLAVAAPAAQGAVTVGSPLDVAPNDSGSGAQTYVQVSLPAGGRVTSPIDGVITRWRARGFTDAASPIPGDIQLRVMHSEDTHSFTAVSSSDARLPATAGGHVFAARLRIRAGEYIGLTQLGNSKIWLDCESCSGSLEHADNVFANGDTQTTGAFPDT